MAQLQWIAAALHLPMYVLDDRLGATTGNSAIQVAGGRGQKRRSESPL